MIKINLAIFEEKCKQKQQEQQKKQKQKPKKPKKSIQIYAEVKRSISIRKLK